MKLTPRESEVLQHLVLGMTSKEIGKATGMAPKTVDKHIEQIRLKRRANSRLQIVAGYFAERA